MSFLNLGFNLGVSTAATLLPQAIVDLYEPAWISDFTLPAQDAQGWTIPTIAVGAQVVYVSEDGNDGTAQTYSDGDFADMFNPSGEQAYLTKAAAIATMRNGEPDVVLFRSGDVFDSSATSTLQGGKSITERSLISSYGTGALPIINATNDANVFLFFGTSKDTRILWLEITAFHRDNNHADYVGDGNVVTDPSAIGAFWAVPNPVGTGLIVEGCHIHHMNNGVSFDGSTATGNNNILRRNTIHDMYKSASGGHPQGFSGDGGVLVEENIAVDCGWFRHDPSTYGAPTIFSHTSYFFYPNECIFRNNISFAPSSIHHKFTSQTPDTLGANRNALYSNVFIDGEVGISIGGNIGGQGLRFGDTRLQGNWAVSMNTSQNGGRTLSWFLDAVDTDVGIIEDNYTLHTDNAAVTNTYAVSILQNANDITVRNNHSYLANSADVIVNPSGEIQTDVSVYGNALNIAASEYMQPTRTIQTYMASIGETPTLEAYREFLKLQDRNNWDARFTNKAIREYLEAGYALVNTSYFITDLADGNYLAGGDYTATVDVVSDGDIEYKYYIDGVIDLTNTTSTFNRTSISASSFTLRCDVIANDVTVTGNTVTISEGTPIVNKFTQTEDLTHTDWSKANLTITGNTAVAPDGSTTAETVTENAGSGEKYMTQAIAVTGGFESYSFYAKYIDLPQVGVRMRIDSVFRNIIFDIQNGTIVNGALSDITNQAITDEGDGWYRCSFTMFNRNQAADLVKFNTFDSGNSSYTGTGRGSYIWGAQLTDGADLEMYTPN